MQQFCKFLFSPRILTTDLLLGMATGRAGSGFYVPRPAPANLNRPRPRSRCPPEVPGYEQGNFIGPTILSDVTVDMECYKEEILGPVLLCMEVNSIHEAINIINSNEYGNGASIFTTSSAAATRFQTEVEVGQVGINVPISVSLPFSSFISSRPSFVGDLNFDGRAGIQFYTQIKRVAKQWSDTLDGDKAILEIPFT